MRQFLITIGSLQYVAQASSSCAAAADAIHLHPGARAISVRALRSTPRHA